MKKKGYYYYAIAILHLLSWAFATHHSAAERFQYVQSLPNNYYDAKNVKGYFGYDEERRIGSSPPKCEHKCGGCEPCVAIQVPTTTQYANYQPEAWKCDCLITS
ncbi:hypothetical protein ACJIZ3_021331 [Penstemon smallii]|uniref:Epidermal patterning factor-like protein n=1 Tax=Penstemon smallii TaxID=265156 RepID=A0ABD3SL42_9LAMI